MVSKFNGFNFYKILWLHLSISWGKYLKVQLFSQWTTLIGLSLVFLESVNTSWIEVFTFKIEAIFCLLVDIRE
jgi:hypothetical protein